MSKLGRQLVAAAVATTALVSGAGLMSAQATPIGPSTTTPKMRTYVPPRVSWGTCADAGLRQSGARCGLMTVPLDYAQPKGPKIKIALSWIKHTTADSSAQGLMLVNPGGPGASGLAMSQIGQWVPKGAGDAYDWIGFDPRGVGASQPRLNCDGNYFPYNRPDYSDPAQEQVWLDKAAGYAAKCDAAGGALLDHMTTRDWVRDMESIRTLFRAQQINFYGFSYGTYLGQAYATAYPSRVRRMVWDGVVDWKDAWYEANFAQDPAFEKNLNIYFGWIAQNNATYGLGATAAAVRANWQSLLDASRQSPLGGKLGPDEWLDSFVSAAYYVYDWPGLAEDFVAAKNGSYAPMIARYGGANGSGPGSDNTYAVYNAVQCTDAPFPADWTTWKARTTQVAQTAPFLTWSNTWYNAPCLTWGAKQATTRPTMKDAGVPPVLLISETNDAATPIAGARTARATFRNSRLIEGLKGTTHASSLSGVRCVDYAIADYLINGKLPPRLAGDVSDLKCGAVPPPSPASANARGAARSDRLPADLRAIITDQPVRR